MVSPLVPDPRCGVPEYPIVDPDVDRLEVLVLDGGRYVRRLQADDPEVVERMGVSVDLGIRHIGRPPPEGSPPSPAEP